MSLTANVRPERRCRAAGGSGWGKGRSSKRSMKAPKSSLSNFLALSLRRRVSARMTIPATVTPITTQTFGFETLIFPRLSCFDIIELISGSIWLICGSIWRRLVAKVRVLRGFYRERDSGSWFWKGFREGGGFYREILVRDCTGNM